MISLLNEAILHTCDKFKIRYVSAHLPTVSSIFTDLSAGGMEEKISNTSICLHRTVGIFSVLFGSTSINRNLSFIVPVAGAHLKFCMQFWAPQIYKDIKLLGSIQRRVTGTVKGLEGKLHEEQLKSFGLFSLEKRRLWR